MKYLGKVFEDLNGIEDMALRLERMYEDSITNQDVINHERYCR